MPGNAVITELVLDARESTAGAGEYERSMARVEAAHDKATTAQQRQMTLMGAGTPQSADRASAAFTKLQASIDPVSAAGHRAAQEMTRALALVDRAVMLGVTTQIDADATISRLRDRQIADIERVRQAQMRLVDTPANDNRAVGNRFNTGNIAAQFQDIGVTAAMGMNPLTIALQQGTTALSGVFQMEDPIKGVGAALAGIVSPVSLVTIGIVALVAAGLQFVDWPKLAAGALNGLAGALETIAPYAAMAAAGLALLYAPAIIGGLVGTIALLGRLAVAAAIAAGAMAAANPALALVAGFTIAVAAGNIFRDELTKIFGVDIIGVVKRAANYILNSFTAAYEDLKFLWNNFGDIMGAAVVGGVNLAIGAVNGLLKSAGEGLDWWIEKLNKIPGVAIGKVGDALQFKPMPNPAADRLTDANAAHKSNIDDIMSRDTIGQFGEGIANGASAAAAKLKELAAGLVDVEKKAKKSSGKSDEDKFDDIIAGANRRIEALKAEQAALGLSEQAALALRYETDMLNEAQRKSIDLTNAQRDQIAGLASKMATLEIATRKAQEAMDFAKGLTRGFIEDLRSGLEEGKGFWQSFGNAALNVLDKIADKLLDDVLDAIFKVKEEGSGSGGGGLLDWLFKGIGWLFGGGASSAAAPALMRPALAAGDPAASMRLDRLPSITSPSVTMAMGRPGTVSGLTPRMHSPANQGGGQQTVRVELDVRSHVSVDDDGKITALVEASEQRTTASTQVAFERFEDNMPNMIKGHQSAPRRQHSRAYGR